MRRAFLILLATLVLAAGTSVLIAKPPPDKPSTGKLPPDKPPPRKPPPSKPPPQKPPPQKPPPGKPPKPGDDGRIISRKLVKREIIGNMVFETYRITRRSYVWDGSKWVAKDVVQFEKITKPLSDPGFGGVIPPTVSVADGPLPDSAVGEAQATPLVAAYLRIENLTGEKLRVHVQFRALNERDEWVWVPADPRESDKSVQYTYDAGESAVLEDSAGKVRAARVRIWAESDSGKVWTTHKGEDFWLVPEDSEGKRRYFAAALRTGVYKIK